VRAQAAQRLAVDVGDRRVVPGERVGEDCAHRVEMWCSLSVVIDLREEPLAPWLSVVDQLGPDRRRPRARLERDAHVLSVFTAGLQDPVRVDPSVPDELCGVEQDEDVDVLDEAEVAEVREEVRLHHPKSHVCPFDRWQDTRAGMGRRARHGREDPA
jgi:hypothetical protein